MKRFDRIILGVFRESFDKTLEKTNALGFAQFSEVIEQEQPYIYYNTNIIQMVEHVINNSNEVIFALDDIRLPLSEDRYSCKELSLILRNDRYFNKTRFFLNLEEVDKNKVKSNYS